MKAETQNSSSTAGSLTNTFLLSDTKYGGLIKQSLTKRIRNSFFLLIGYIDTSSPHFLPLHIVITYFRFFQFLGPAFFAASERFWPLGELQQKIVSYVSILFHIVPIEYRYTGAFFIEVIYFVVIVFYFILMLISSYVYKTTSKLPKVVVVLITILNGSVMFLIHPVAIQMASQELSRLIMGMDTYVSTALASVGVVITYLCAIFYMYMFSKTMSVTIIFRPCSFLTTLNVPQILLMVSTNVITLFSGLATYLSKGAYIVLTVLVFAIMVLTTFIIFFPGSFIKSSDSRLLFSGCVTGAITSLIVMVFAIIDEHASMVVLFVAIAIFVIAFLVSFPVIDRYERKCLKTLDEIHNDSDIEVIFKKPSNLIRDACIGFKYAHPCCLDWSVFKHGTSVWDDSGTLWCTFGKFVAIYPEETSLMTYIIRSIETRKMKGTIAKQTIALGRSVLTQRESSLPPQLKRKMQRISKSVQHSKRKLRHIWAIVIQGNTHEMENAVNNAYNSVNKTQFEFNHVLSQYPNNRFISRSYARYLQEIKADFKGFQEWVEKVKLLQRGLHATIDNIHVLGINAFPNLPHKLSVKNEITNIQINQESESVLQLEIDIEDDQVNENISSLREQIQSLNIPAITCVSITSVIIFIVLILAPVIVVFIVSKTFINSLNDPLEFMYHLSYLRTLANQLPAFSFHSIFESYPPENPLFSVPNYSDIDITSLGHRKKTTDQYAYLIKSLTSNLESLGKYRSYESQSELLSKDCDQIFKSVLNYSFYNNGSFNSINVSIQTALMDYSIQLSRLSTVETITKEILGSPVVMNPLTNTEMITTATSISINSIIELLRHTNDTTNKLMMIILISLIVFFAVFYTVVTIIEVKKLQSNKSEVYSCLTSLPKNVVSSLAEQLRILKKDSGGTRTTETDTEMTKHEDNILKIFATGGDSSSTISSDKHIFIICNILFFVIDALLTYFLTQMFTMVTDKLLENGPHLNYIFGSIAYMMDAMNTLNIAAAAFTEYFEFYPVDKMVLLNSLKESFDLLNYYYQQARYGSNGTNEPPFAYFNQINEQASSKFACPDQNALPQSYRDIYRCFSADQQTTLFIGLSQKLALPVIMGNSSFLNSSDPLFDELWYISAVSLYESFFNPMFGTLLPELHDAMNSSIPNTLPPAIILIIIGLIIVIAIISFASADVKKLKFALSLLLHCQYQVLMQTQKITDVLNGHFSSRSKDMVTRNSRFFTEVVKILPDSIIVINNQLQIISANKSTERIYDIDSSDLEGTKITDFLSSKSFSTDVSSVVNTPSAAGAALQPTPVEYKKDGKDKLHLELSCITVNQHFILTTQDVTRRFIYNTLIEEERAKSDRLLASILPPSLVGRVQKGEKNISFAVQSATILFLDIVEFTPWCGSNTAAMVMSTLNTMFKLLDNKLATHPTATKIKCIGDCYMCAGGIFSEVNQPNIHAKEIVEFGQESIDCVRLLDEQQNLSLRIRVGINTGGPIVAGVLGTEKPTFEILGPAINMAQQMEHHGVPMQVHISRSVYELVYGGAFVIKERGQIEIKSGKVITYLVQDKNAPPS